jgi:DNA/RNA endonuclease YhcR with UshA esterase domain
MLRPLRPIITSIVLIAGAGPARADSLNPEEAASNIGKTATVCGLVASATYAAASTAAPTFLDFGKPFPNETFTAVIFGSDRKKFGAPEMALRDKQICVTGEIRLYRGKPQIILRDPKQLSER